MIVSFESQAVEDIFNGKNSRAARRACPGSLHRVTARKLDQLDSVAALDELRKPSGNRLEALIGNRKGQYSIRINQQYRLCFEWTEAGPENVAIVDYH